MVIILLLNWLQVMDGTITIGQLKHQKLPCSERLTA